MLTQWAVATPWENSGCLHAHTTDLTPSHPAHPLICAIRDITVVVKKVVQNPVALQL